MPVSTLTAAGLEETLSPGGGAASNNLFSIVMLLAANEMQGKKLAIKNNKMRSWVIWLGLVSLNLHGKNGGFIDTCIFFELPSLNKNEEYLIL